MSVCARKGGARPVTGAFNSLGTDLPAERLPSLPSCHLTIGWRVAHMAWFIGFGRSAPAGTAEIQGHEIFGIHNHIVRIAAVLHFVAIIFDWFGQRELVCVCAGSRLSKPNNERVCVSARLFHSVQRMVGVYLWAIVSFECIDSFGIIHKYRFVWLFVYECEQVPTSTYISRGRIRIRDHFQSVWQTFQRLPPKTKHQFVW